MSREVAILEFNLK